MNIYITEVNAFTLWQHYTSCVICFSLSSEMLEEQASILRRAIIQIHEGKYFMLLME